MKYVKATLRNNCFVFPADKLLSVLDGEIISAVPFAPVDNLGIVKYQNEVIPVFDSLSGENASARLLLVLKNEDHIFACMNKRKLRVVIIDNNTELRKYLIEVLNTDSMIEVVGSSGIIQGEKLISEHKPDIITIEPGNLESVGFREATAVVSKAKVPVVVISAFPDSRQELIKSGAWDFVDKSDTLDAGLSAQFEYLVKLRIKTQATTPAPVVKKTVKGKPHGTMDHNRETIIVMGASLGGTEVIYKILQQLPNTLPGIVIVQHMPQNFTNAYAIRLNEGSKIEVREARDGDEVLRGTALVAPGGRQLTIRPHGSGYSVPK